MKRILVPGLMAVSLLVLAGCSTPNSVPLAKSKEQVRGWILERTPLGSSYNQVYTFIKHEQWDIEEEVRKDGTLRQIEGHVGNLKIIASSVRCDLGTTHYVYFPFPTDVLATWAFDRDNHLIDVWIDHDTVGAVDPSDPNK